MDNLFSMEHLDEEGVMRLIRRALEMKSGNYKPYQKPKYIANLFFEDSTRTKTSFEMAELKMNVTSIPFDVNYSSVSEGETLYDTCKTLESLGAGALVISHSATENNGQLTGHGMPVLNAGVGRVSHPTTA